MQMQTNRTHNAITLGSLEKGDLVEFQRGFYSHWGVYIGNEDIVHLCGEDDDGIDGGLQAEHLYTFSGVKFDKANVRIHNFWNIVQDCKAFKNNKDSKRSPLHPDEIVKNALSKIGHVGYNLITQNCEHFATWCRYGEEKSDQVDNVLTGFAVGAAAFTAVGFIAGIAKLWGTSEEEEKQKERKMKS